jgi:SAM-dependent methyltransferase
MGSLFEDIPAALDSAAFCSYCDMVYGYGLRLDDALIQEDVEAICAFAAFRKSERVLDLGCGAGDLLRFLCHRNGCRGIGVDAVDLRAAWLANSSRFTPLHGMEPGLMRKALSIEAPAGRSLLQKAKSLLSEGDEGFAEPEPGQAAFLRRDMGVPMGIAGQFDLILAVDSLSLVDEPGRVLDRLLPALKPGGCMLVSHTERSEGRGPLAEENPGSLDKNLEFSWTRIGRALKGRRLRVNGHDIGKSEKLHWKLSRRLLDKLKGECAAEGLPELHERVAEETARGLEAVERDGFRRYWYRIERPA